MGIGNLAQGRGFEAGAVENDLLRAEQSIVDGQQPCQGSARIVEDVARRSRSGNGYGRRI